MNQYSSDGQFFKLDRIVTLRQQPGEQSKDQKPGVIQANANPQDPAQWDILSAHLMSSALRSR